MFGHRVRLDDIEESIICRSFALRGGRGWPVKVMPIQSQRQEILGKCTMDSPRSFRVVPFDLGSPRGRLRDRENRHARDPGPHGRTIGALVGLDSIR